jgi:putative transposase
MPRVARLVLPELPHHILHRAQQPLFTADEDRVLYLRLLGEEGRRWGLTLLGYCLMADHVHLIALPRISEALAQAVGRAHYRYAQLLNRHHARAGHLWHNRFDSAPLDPDHLLLAMRYVEQNPLRADLCRRPWEYAWSSAAVHCGWGKAAGDAPLDQAYWRQAAAQLDWNHLLRQPLDEPQLQRLRHATSRGRPLGSEAWISHLETTLGRPLRARPVGRPRKSVVQASGL